MVDENEFFRNATLRICGNLAIEEGLRACFEYLSQHMPADRMYLQRHQRDLGAMQFVARANAEMCEKMDVLIPYSEQARAVMADMDRDWRTGTLAPVLVADRKPGNSR